jgi:hypothetical protein
MTMSETINAPLHNVSIDHGADVLSVKVPKHEIDVLRAVHGPVQVRDNGESDEEIELSANADDEWARLTRKYHRLNSPDPAGIAYRAGPRALEEFGFSLGRGATAEAPQSALRNHAKKVVAKLIKPQK